MTFDAAAAKENAVAGVRRSFALRGEWKIIWLGWTAVGLFFVAQSYFTSMRSERPVRLVDAAFVQFSYCYSWALVTPLVLRLARRWPIEQKTWRRALTLHALFSTAFVLLVGLMLFVLNYFYWLYPEGRTPDLMRVARNVVLNASENYGIYALILAGRQAFDYYTRFREGELRSSQLEARLAHAQLQALKMQLHPHFLFNTLHSISSLIHKDPDDADKMIARLGDFLRLTLENSGAQEVTLRQELDFLRCYLDIERIRFQDRLTTRLNIAPQALDARVPNLILQPIVENAIRHGVAPRSAPATIEISAARENGVLRLSVADDGPGLPANQTVIQSFTRGGVGLANTRARLEQLYGAAYRFELQNRPEGGTLVTLTIPAKANDERGTMNDE